MRYRFETTMAAGAGLFLCLGIAAGRAITPAALEQLQHGAASVTVIDVRSMAEYQRAHIAEAINIPETLLAEKQLPRLGRVVVYGRGLGDQTAARAVQVLNQKPGITAEALEGGFTAWQTQEQLTTQGKGMTRQTLPLITYRQLKAASPRKTVLVDLRRPATETRSSSQGASPPPALTDLHKAFPQFRIVKSPVASPFAPQSVNGAGGVPPVLVLIDNGDGTAEKWARTLLAQGNHRFAILAGGESIIARQGRPGLQRVGAAIPGGRIPSSPTEPKQP